MEREVNTPRIECRGDGVMLNGGVEYTCIGMMGWRDGGRIHANRVL